jgi:ribonuclease HI
MQYIFIVFNVAAGGERISLDSEYDKYMWRAAGEMEREKLTSSTAIILGITDVHAAQRDKGMCVTDVNGQPKLPEHMVVYSDGGSRGNPGPSASGFVILDACDNVLSEGGEYLGITTNNQAEYRAVELALMRAHELGAKTIDFRLDSQLVANQLNGIYKLKDPALAEHYRAVRELMKQFQSVTFTHVMREHNRLADGMVNKILDEAGK